jgi:hypothetical protein
MNMQIGISSIASHHVLLSKKHTYMSPRAVKDGVAQSFDVLVLAFGRVLMLLMRLALPSGNV